MSNFKKLFETKDIVFAAIIAAAMLVVSMITVPLVVGIPLKKIGTATIVSLFTSIPMAFISPVITLFTIVAVMMAAGTWMGIAFVKETTVADIFLKSLFIMIGFLGSVGAFAATKISKEFKGLIIDE